MVLSYTFSTEYCRIQRASVLSSLGEYYSGIGQRSTAIQQHSESLKLLWKVYSIQGKFHEAEAAFQRVIELVTEREGPDSIAASTIRHELAFGYQHQDRLEEAETFQRQVLAIAKNRGKTDFALGFGIQRLARIVDWRKKYAEALELRHDALAYYSDSLGISHPLTLRSRDFLVGCLIDDRPSVAEMLERMRLLTPGPPLPRPPPSAPHLEAENIGRENLRLAIDTLGHEHNLTIDIRTRLAETLACSLANLMADNQRHEEAEELTKKNMRLDGGINDEKAAMSSISGLLNLAWKMMNSGKLDHAERLMRETLKMNIEAAGAESPAAEGSMRHLANYLEIQGKLEDAELLYQEVDRLSPQALDAPSKPDDYDDDNVFSKRIMKNESVFQKAIGDANVKMATGVHGGEHEGTIDVMERRGAHLKELLERYDDAKRLLEDALKLRLKPVFLDQQQIMDNMDCIQQLYLELGSYQDAENLGQQILKRQTDDLGPSHAKTISSMAWLGDFYRYRGRYQEAETMARELLRLRTEEFAPFHEIIVEAMEPVGDLCCAQEKFDEAETVYRDILRLGTANCGSEHVDTWRH
ncbi:uncharacterized protein PAC_03978 [Phialocephala subalpina]|uniref:Kinesin light chain n=1 Tax=Phialocephala subalpina TaxID=576137 RepID=A0A1L7WMU4_9HELO|nr:uncharacterized protein PAC_03978 [Phialocephala subalpina]